MILFIIWLVGTLVASVPMTAVMARSDKMNAYCHSGDRTEFKSTCGKYHGRDCWHRDGDKADVWDALFGLGAATIWPITLSLYLVMYTTNHVASDEIRLSRSDRRKVKQAAQAKMLEAAIDRAEQDAIKAEYEMHKALNA